MIKKVIIYYPDNRQSNIIELGTNDGNAKEITQISYEEIFVALNNGVSKSFVNLAYELTY